MTADDPLAVPGTVAAAFNPPTVMFKNGQAAACLSTMPSDPRQAPGQGLTDPSARTVLLSHDPTEVSP